METLRSTRPATRLGFARVVVGIAGIIHLTTSLLLLLARNRAMTSTSSAGGASTSTMEFVKIVAGFAVIYLVLDRSAAWTNSLYGEYGLLICALVIAAALLVEGLLFGRTPRQALGALGFGRPTRRGLLAALLASLALLAYFPILALISGQPL